MIRKAIIRKGIFIALGFVFIYYFVFGSRGIVEYLKLRQEIRQEEQKVQKFRDEIHTLSTQITDWQQNPLKMETVARHDLGMGFTNEIVYLLPR